MAALPDPEPSLHAEAAARLYERFRAPIYRFCLAQLRSREDAEDAVQNTFLRAYTALGEGVRPRTEAAWLYTIAHNVCLSRKLAGARRGHVETPRDLDRLPAASSHDADPLELLGLEAALAEMPPRPREAILLREWQGLSYGEIADELDVSRSAVESLIFRARRHLAQALRSSGRRARALVDAGSLAGLLRSLLGGSGAKVGIVGAGAVAAAVAAGPSLHRGFRHTLPAGPSPRQLQTQPTAVEPSGTHAWTAQPAARLASVPAARRSQVPPPAPVERARVQTQPAAPEPTGTRGQTAQPAARVASVPAVRRSQAQAAPVEPAATAPAAVSAAPPAAAQAATTTVAATEHRVPAPAPATAVTVPPAPQPPSTAPAKTAQTGAQTADAVVQKAASTGAAVTTVAAPTPPPATTAQAAAAPVQETASTTAAVATAPQTAGPAPPAQAAVTPPPSPPALP